MLSFVGDKFQSFKNKSIKSSQYSDGKSTLITKSLNNIFNSIEKGDLHNLSVHLKKLKLDADSQAFLLALVKAIQSDCLAMIEANKGNVNLSILVEAEKILKLLLKKIAIQELDIDPVDINQPHESLIEFTLKLYNPDTIAKLAARSTEDKVKEVFCEILNGFFDCYATSFFLKVNSGNKGALTEEGSNLIKELYDFENKKLNQEKTDENAEKELKEIMNLKDILIKGFLLASRNKDSEMFERFHQNDIWAKLEGNDLSEKGMTIQRFATFITNQPLKSLEAEGSLTKEYREFAKIASKDICEYQSKAILSDNSNDDDVRHDHEEYKKTVRNIVALVQGMYEIVNNLQTMNPELASAKNKKIYEENQKICENLPQPGKIRRCLAIIGISLLVASTAVAALYFGVPLLAASLFHYAVTSTLATSIAASGGSFALAYVCNKSRELLETKKMGYLPSVKCAQTLFAQNRQIPLKKRLETVLDNALPGQPG